MEEFESLLIRAKGNDLSAFGELVRRFQGMALNYAYAVLGDYHLAEDAVQWVLVRGLEATPENVPQDAIEEGVRQALNLDGKIQITVASKNPA